MKNRNRLVNVGYSLAQGGYWMSLCAAINCAAILLQYRGYSNAQLGLIIAAGSAASFFLSPVLGGIVDRSKRLDSYWMIWILLVFHLLFVAALRVFPGRSAAVSIIYSLYITVNMCLVPLITQLCFEMEGRGYSINFGVARGLGSLSFAIAASILGPLVDRLSPEVLVEAGIVITLFQMLVLVLMGYLRARGTPIAEAAEAKEDSSSMLRFIGENKRFVLLMLGIAMLFFTHYLVNNFLINIVRNVGGGTKEFGYFSSFMAVVELPAMFFYARISRRLSCARCVRIAVVFFTLKALFLALATNLFGLFAAQSLQMISYALLTPALVEYVDIYVPRKDAARGQAVSYAMTTLGGIFASLLGGIMFDSMSVRSTLLAGTAVASVGLVICLLSVERKAKAK